MKHNRREEIKMKAKTCICGTDPIIETVHDDDADYDFVVVKCPNCGRITPKKFSDRKAIISWNISQTALARNKRNE